MPSASGDRVVEVVLEVEVLVSVLVEVEVLVEVDDDVVDSTQRRPNGFLPSSVNPRGHSARHSPAKR